MRQYAVAPLCHGRTVPQHKNISESPTCTEEVIEADHECLVKLCPDVDLSSRRAPWSGDHTHELSDIVHGRTR